MQAGAVGKMQHCYNDTAWCTTKNVSVFGLELVQNKGFLATDLGALSGPTTKHHSHTCHLKKKGTHVIYEAIAKWLAVYCRENSSAPK